MKASEVIAAKLPAKAKRERWGPKDLRRDRGLLHGLRSVRVEDVSARMHVVCCACEKAPKVRRLCVQSGSGRYGKKAVYCIGCGGPFLERGSQEYARARLFLRLGGIPVKDRLNHAAESEGIRL